MRNYVLGVWCGLLLAQASAHGETIVVIGSRPDDSPEKLDHILREVDGTKITVTKKSSVTKLDLVPTIIGNNQRELFARTPGLFVSEQQTPTQFNMSYRGLGNPQEAEYVLLLQDGLPISTDWIGFPTAYYMPLPQSLAEVQMIRGGSSLLYGPNPAPAVNLVSRRPRRDQPLGAYSENVGGTDDLFSTFNALEGSLEKLSMRINVGYTRTDGQRENGEAWLRQTDLLLDYYVSDEQRWSLDVHDHDASSGDPGKLSYRQFKDDPDRRRRRSITTGCGVRP
jgi:Fe(3+) dicitrate transport protein